MEQKMKSGIKWFGGILLSVFVEYLLSQLGIIDITKTFFTSNNHKLILFLNRPIPLWNVISFLILTALSYLFILKVVFRKRKSSEEKDYELKEEFKKKYKFMRIPDNDTIEFKTDFYFSGDNITLNNIETYCIKHDNRVKMYLEPNNPLFYICPTFPCKNGFVNFPENRENVKHQILSRLENEWEKLQNTRAVK